MKRHNSAIIISLFVFLTGGFLAARAAAVGTWQNYMAYHDIEKVEKAGTDLFVLASGGLYQYNENDGSITTYDKVRGLSDTHIDHISWNRTTRSLIAVYDNSNIDIIEPNGDITNISDLYTKAMTEDKTVNSVYIDGKYAYLATGFGAVKVNMANREISESYMLGFNVGFIYTENNRIYASSKTNGLFSAPLTANLLDRNNWQRVGEYVDKTTPVDPELLAKVKDLHPGGPKYNNFYKLVFNDGRLYSVGGQYSSSNQNNFPGTVQVLENDNWTIYQDQLNTITGYDYLDNNTLVIDPLAPQNHVFVGGRTGMYEFENGRLKNYFNKDNSPLDDARNYGNTYVIVNGLCFDTEGDLWVLNSKSDSKNILKYKKDGTWESRFHSELVVDGRAMDQLVSPIFDSRGLLWFVNADWRNTALICYNTETDKVKLYNTFKNQDGVNVAVVTVQCVAEDKEGNIWIGTNVGPLYITPDNITSGSDEFVQFKVPRNDGTEYADYLLTGTDIRSITVDGAGRKWFATAGNGAYLISADNLTQEQHFLTENSELLSDNINSIDIDGKTGEVFFATDKGLCSYISNATAPSDEMTKDNVYAYPNPVTPEYTGLISIVGLTLDADVKITTATGSLVYQGRSTGGMFTWDGNDLKGRRVNSGVYSVITATSDGKKGTVCKIAIVR